MPGIPDAELPDQSWMSPETAKKLPAAPYSEFNPPPLVKESAQHAEYVRSMRKGIIQAVIGITLLAIALYLHFH